MVTIHANSAREALVKMCTLPLLAGENISAAIFLVRHTYRIGLETRDDPGVAGDKRRGLGRLGRVTRRP